MASFREEEVMQILEEFWEEIAHFSFEGYHTQGRGVVGLEKTVVDGADGEDVGLLYTIYDFEDDKPDSETAVLIRDYDPDWEILLHYLGADGAVHTKRVRTSPGARHPWRIWIFDRLRQAAEEEAAMES